ncbi:MULTISPECIES: hypothetical protein [unclassified Chelatococcus]|uniref:hypothetical protein n=1 Tax=unclassified Chelatococcus TaxID=2638111 RepID=UPI0004751C4B|nr:MULTISPECIES: hypothetical protein [unclassified Chelatococcus]ALA20423.1 hypothetical protein AL346_23775 [Chelatococcus sp. CO-6]
MSIAWPSRRRILPVPQVLQIAPRWRPFTTFGKEAGLVVAPGIGVDAIPVTLADARQLQRLEPLGGAAPGPQHDAQADIAFQREAYSEALVAAR